MAICGGLRMGQLVYYVGRSRTCGDGVTLTFAVRGVIAGVCTRDPEKVSVLFAGRARGTDCDPSELRLRPPAAPGGFELLEEVFFAGEAGRCFSGGQPLAFGARGTVAGVFYCSEGGRVTVHFGDASRALDCRPYELSREQPLAPGGFRPGDAVHFAGISETLSSGECVPFGTRGAVLSASCEGERPVIVGFEGVALAMACRPRDLSRVPPLLPGGFQLGGQVHFIGGTQALQGSGALLTFGCRGTVCGASFAGPEDRVAVRFEGRDRPTNCRPAELADRPPRIPGGFQLGDTVHFDSHTQTLASGALLRFGASGTVTGARLDGRDERVTVRFEGHAKDVSCRPDELSRDVPSIPGGFQPGDLVVFTGGARSGGRPDCGIRGKVGGVSRSKGLVYVCFDGIVGGLNCRPGDLSRAPCEPEPASPKRARA